MNILGLCYLFGKTYKQPTIASTDSWSLRTADVFAFVASKKPDALAGKVDVY